MLYFDSGIYLDFLGEATTSYTKTGLMVKKNQNGNGKLNMTGRDVILQTRIYYVGSQHCKTKKL